MPNVELKPGQIVKGYPVRSRRPIYLAGILFAAAFAFTLARTGTTVTHTGETSNVVCGVMGCSGNNPAPVKGGNHATTGGGTIK